jgi:subtilisin family serine protease
MPESAQEYVVCLTVEADADVFWDHMELDLEQVPHVPDRCVHVVNERPGSRRICHYALTPTEAQLLKADPRVLSVELPIHAQDHIHIMPDVTQYSNFTKTTLQSGNFINWGLKRCVSATNNYGTSSQAEGGFPYTLDGTGVDVVVMDSGIQPDHPEFQDAQGVSRVQQIDWYLAAGITGSQSVNFYRDWEGHGTHVAGICVGKTYGWARNALIYSIKLAGLEGTGDEGTGMSITDAMDVLKLWHQNKTPDPQTGVKRPTVVNMSWGYVTQFINITGGNYRGTPWTGTSRRQDLGMIGSNLNFGVRVSATDVDVVEMTEAGVHVSISAGNYYQKNDVSTGADYNNYFFRSGIGAIYYHRGSSPHADLAIRVGSMDTQVRDTLTEYKSVFSDAGPAVDVWAPGSFVMSACSTTNTYSGVAYYANSEFKQVNISGTSMSAPQVAGVISLYLQLNPWATPSQVKTWLLSQSQPTIYTTGSDTDYTSNRSLLGSVSRVMFQPFNAELPLSSLGDVGWTGVNL